MSDIQIARDELLATLERVGQTGVYPLGVERLLVDDYGRERFAIAELAARAEAAERAMLGDLLPPQDWQDADADLWGWRVFITLAVVREACVGAEPERTERLHVAGARHCGGDLHVLGDLEIGQRAAEQGQLVVGGDLRVEGDLRIHDGSQLIVLGDLHVEGSFLDVSEWCLACVLGDMVVRDAMLSSGELFVCGSLTAPFVYLSYNHGHAQLFGGATVCVLIESDHGDSRVWGDADVGFALVDELRGLEEEPRVGDYEGLGQILYDPALVDAALDEFGEVDPWRLTDLLVERVEAGQPLLLGPGRGPLFGERYVNE